MSALINVYDTETTGLPDFHAPSDAPHQPHIVDIAALLYDESGQLVDSFEAIIKPDGWTIPKEVSDIHGITQEMAMDVGIPELDALDGFLAIHARAGPVVAAHLAEKFDVSIATIRDIWGRRSWCKHPKRYDRKKKLRHSTPRKRHHIEESNVVH